MPKGLQIKIYAEGTQGRVDIIGNISEWSENNNAVDFRERCQELKDSGATQCHVYLMTNGGDCFQANEIVNILIEIFGNYTGEGGAIVASAGTYIAVNATSFLQAKNGQWMIHKPSGGAYGNETDIENTLKLLQNMTTTYYDSYKAKLKKPEADFKTKWDGGDIWMTAQEAKDWGFVTDIKEPVKVTKALADSITASGSPLAFDPQDIIISNQNKENEMNLQAIALVLGLVATATEDQITAKIAENAAKAALYDNLKAQVDQDKQEAKTAEIKALLDTAEKDKRINATTRPQWDAQLNANLDSTKPLLAGLQPVVKLSTGLTAEDATAGTYQGKTFEQLQDESPEVLAELEDTNPEAFKALHADWKKRNRIK